MIAQGTGGAILFTSSTNGKTADANWSAYNTSKHGLIGFMRCLAAEVGGHDIRVNAVCPGWVETKMADEIHHTLADDAKQPFERFMTRACAPICCMRSSRQKIRLTCLSI